METHLLGFFIVLQFHLSLSTKDPKAKPYKPQPLEKTASPYWRRACGWHSGAAGGQTPNSRTSILQQGGCRYLQPVLRVLSGRGIEDEKDGDAQSTTRTCTEMGAAKMGEKKKKSQSCRDGRNSQMGMTPRSQERITLLGRRQSFSRWSMHSRWFTRHSQQPLETLEVLHARTQR